MLKDRGVPVEIAALPHVESSFNAAAYSKVGAAGLWQFMPTTAKRFMRVDGIVDERLDPYSADRCGRQLDALQLPAARYLAARRHRLQSRAGRAQARAG